MDDGMEYRSDEETMVVHLRERARACLQTALKLLEGRPEPTIPHAKDADAASATEKAAAALGVLADMWSEDEMAEEANREPPVMGGPNLWP